ncbi:uncharacterized protein A1O9_02934 [Exophiala aquamarina CBS 119918]|uniref:Uncharacterized protein n=1 Tax=Exophiala aquamarina CBS 119918 TaxID=1182545 RepID=A0A072PPW2_9EURO|nr:uncharacterized protein A1O9_02934 [Exophiala aquamarina CBS 119918]KEF61368.1 hypothetical protein A1O9_02934 [Exophiala aquamarina CBS 119918]
MGVPVDIMTRHDLFTEWHLSVGTSDSDEETHKPIQLLEPFRRSRTEVYFAAGPHHLRGRHWHLPPCGPPSWHLVTSTRSLSCISGLTRLASAFSLVASIFGSRILPEDGFGRFIGRVLSVHGLNPAKRLGIQGDIHARLKTEPIYYFILSGHLSRVHKPSVILMDKDTGKTSGNIPFVFINSSQDRPRKSRDDSFTISSHVSRTHRARLKKEKWKRLRDSATKVLAQRPIYPAALPLNERAYYQGPAALPSAAGQAQTRRWESLRFITDGSRTSSAGAESATISFGTGRSQHPLPFQDSQETVDQQDPRPFHALAIDPETTWRTSEPPLSLWKGNSDPFTTTAVPLNAYNNEILRHAQRFFIFTAWPGSTNAVFRTPIADTRNSHIKLNDATQDEGQLHAILASGYRVESKLFAAQGEWRRAQESVHKSRAVAVLRQRLLSGKASPSIVSLLRLLISLEFDDDDHSTALLHLRGLLAMALSNPALLAEAEGLLLVSDVWIAMSLGKRPEIWPTRYDPGARHLQPFNAAQKLETDSSTSPSPIVMEPDVELKYYLDACTISLLNSAVEIVRSKELMVNTKDSSLQRQVVTWMHRRATAISGYLLSGYLDAIESTRAPDLTAPALVQKRVIATSCLTGILFMNLEFCESPSNYNFSKAFLAIEPALRSVYGQLIHAESDAQREIYLWLLFMCALGNDVYSARGDIPYSKWPAYTFHQFRKQLLLHSLIDVKKVLDVFLYHDVVDVFLEGLLSPLGEAPSCCIVSWTRWCSILHHYVPDSIAASIS